MLGQHVQQIDRRRLRQRGQAQDPAAAQLVDRERRQAQRQRGPNPARAMPPPQKNSKKVNSAIRPRKIGDKISTETFV